MMDQGTLIIQSIVAYFQIHKISTQVICTGLLEVRPLISDIKIALNVIVGRRMCFISKRVRFRIPGARTRKVKVGSDSTKSCG